jgi:hypothetical protein
MSDTTRRPSVTPPLPSPHRGSDPTPLRRYDVLPAITRDTSRQGITGTRATPRYLAREPLVPKRNGPVFRVSLKRATAGILIISKWEDATSLRRAYGSGPKR